MKNNTINIKVFEKNAVLIGMPGDKLYITNKNGTQLTGSVLRSTKVERSKIASNNKELNLLFDFYNKTSASISKDIINGSAMSRIYRDFALAAGGDSVLSPEEIQEFLKKNELSGKVSEKSVREFLARVSDVSTVNVLYEDLNAIGTKSSFKSHLNSIPSQNMINIMSQFKKEYGVSLVQMIANESGCMGSTREGYLNVIRDKIMATKEKPDAEKFKTGFDKIIGEMDMTIFKEADAAELTKYVEKNGYPRPKYPAPAKRSAAELEAFNKKVISQLMDSPVLSKNQKNKDKITEKIMKYAKLNNPAEMVKSYLKDSNPQVRQAAQNLINSTYLDYFPIYVACIIAQESKFLEVDDSIFSPNGQGVMQVTKSLTDDIVERPKIFGDAFIERLKQYNCNPKDSNNIYKTIQGKTKKAVGINYDVGVAGLRSKLETYFQQIKNGTYENLGMDLTQPSVMLEFMARNYNGNKAGKKDYQQGGVMSEVREVYGRDVIERFRRCTPPDVFVRDYFQYDPRSKTYEIITE